MKLIYVFAAILAISLAETEKREIADSEAVATVELLKERPADLKAEASAYNTYVPPSQRPPVWNVPTYVPPVNTWNPPKEPLNTWNPPKVPDTPVYNPWPVQSDYPHHPQPPVTWSTPHYHHPTTTPASVIKNEQHYYDNGAYKYEYQITDGTHVGEEGYFTDPKHDDESLVKRGWYSFVGADGKTYTVTYWADKTGFHAYGDHLPTPPPVPAAIQAALDKEKEKPQQGYYTTTQAPVYYPTHPPTYAPPQQPTYYPTQPTYYPNHQHNYNNYPSYGKK